MKIFTSKEDKMDGSLDFVYKNTNHEYPVVNCSNPMVSGECIDLVSYRETYVAYATDKKNQSYVDFDFGPSFLFTIYKYELKSFYSSTPPYKWKYSIIWK